MWWVREMTVAGAASALDDGLDGGDGDSAMGAEDGSGFDRAAAGGAWGGGDRRLVREGRGGADLAGDIGGLRGVVAADATGHEEGFDETEDGGDAGPGEEQVEKTEAGAAQVEVVYPEASEEDGEKDADDFVATGVLVLGVEPSSLVIVHSVGVDRIDEVHG